MGKFSPPSKKEIREAIARKQENFNRQEDNKLAAIRLAGENQMATQKLQNAGSLAEQGLRNAGGLAQQTLQNSGALSQQKLKNEGGLSEQGLRNKGAIDLAGVNNAANLVGEQLRTGADLVKSGVNPKAVGSYINSARLPQQQTTNQQIMHSDLTGGVDASPQGRMSLTIGGNGIRNNMTGQQVNTQAARLAGPQGLNTAGMVVPERPVEQNWQSFDKVTGQDNNGLDQKETLLVDKNSGRVMRPETNQEREVSSIFDRAAQNSRKARLQQGR